MTRTRLIERLEDYALAHPDERDAAVRFASFVADEPRCFERTCWRGHVTGSAWVVDRTGARVLLTHHRKLDRWLQLGGHSDGDSDTLRVASREAFEESGLSLDLVSPALFDVDIHLIPPRGNDPAHFHFDARFAFVAQDEAFRASSESHALAWVEIAKIRSVTNEPSMLRMAEKWLRKGPPEHLGRFRAPQ